MQQVYVVMTSCLSTTLGRIDIEPLLAFKNKKDAESYANTRQKSDDLNKEAWSREGVFDIKYWVEDIYVEESDEPEKYEIIE